MGALANRRAVQFLGTLAVFTLACGLSRGAEGPTDTAEPTRAEPQQTEVLPTMTMPAPTDTPQPPTPTITHLTRPNEPPARYLYMTDSASASEAGAKAAKGGDDYQVNRFERPFTAQEMAYQPALDLLEGEISFDDEWLYFSLIVQDIAELESGSNFTYGVELDLDSDGDGDWLISASQPAGGDWDTEGVRAYFDADDDVGGSNKLAPDDPDSQGDGYEVLIFDSGVGQDPDSAWSRIAPQGENKVQIAVRRSLLQEDSAFLWSVWSGESRVFAQTFDLNDSFTIQQAGSPLAGSPEYPLKELASVDNTCRMYFGFTPSGSEPGLCQLYATVQNCTPHRMLGKPGDIFLDGQETAGGVAIKQVPAPATYSFYDQDDLNNQDEHPLVLTVTLQPGGLAQIVMTGLGDTYTCK